MNVSQVKVEVLIPESYIPALRDRLNNAGILRVANYDHVISYTHTKGYWRPLNEAVPFNGTKNEVSFGEECKLEFRCSIEQIQVVKAIILEIHPYEEPIINVIQLLPI